MVVNRYTGLAIEGFDPVAYFVDGQASVGLAEFEASAAGAVWRFRNEGNRASFAAHPEIYGPQFGGYDPVDVARGVTVAGNPWFWLISGQRLYLFGREDNRKAFAADPAGRCARRITLAKAGADSGAIEIASAHRRCEPGRDSGSCFARPNAAFTPPPPDRPRR